MKGHAWSAGRIQKRFGTLCPNVSVPVQDHTRRLFAFRVAETVNPQYCEWEEYSWKKSRERNTADTHITCDGQNSSMAAQKYSTTCNSTTGCRRVILSEGIPLTIYLITLKLGIYKAQYTTGYVKDEKRFISVYFLRLRQRQVRLMCTSRRQHIVHERGTLLVFYIYVKHSSPVSSPFTQKSI